MLSSFTLLLASLWSGIPSQLTRAEGPTVPISVMREVSAPSERSDPAAVASRMILHQTRDRDGLVTNMGARSKIQSDTRMREVARRPLIGVLQGLAESFRRVGDCGFAIYSICGDGF